jgi:hypothetical protein
VYDDNCVSPGNSCTEIAFEDEEADGDNIFDFSGNVSTSCDIGENSYKWTFTHIPSNTINTYDGAYIDNFNFSLL